MGRRRKPITIAGKKSEIEKEGLDTLKKFFLLHAVDFYRQADRILSDSRMFLVPVPVNSALAYIGTSGFSHPTLGVYIEWWMRNTEVCRQVKDKLWLTYHIAGSPLSGCNHCSCVNDRTA